MEIERERIEKDNGKERERGGGEGLVPAHKECRDCSWCWSGQECQLQHLTSSDWQLTKTCFKKT